MKNSNNTFASQEKELLSKGFKIEVLNRFISRFKSDTQYAFVTYLGIGKGFETTYYAI